MFVKAGRYFFETSAVLRASDDPAAGELLIVFVTPMGHDPIRLGGVDRVEALAHLNEAVEQAARRSAQEGGSY